LRTVCGIGGINCYCGKAGATVKSAVPNAGNAVWYGYAGKAGAIVKSTIPNPGNAVRYGYSHKCGAAVAYG